jgi:glutamyl-tRNA synthetase
LHLDDFNLDIIENMMRSTLEELDIKTRVGFQSARVAITGTKISPPLFESIFALGKETVYCKIGRKYRKIITTNN